VSALWLIGLTCAGDKAKSVLVIPVGLAITLLLLLLRAGTCAGIRYPEMKALGIQYHPEASPGPHDAEICFDEFIDMMKADKGSALASAA
jgi:carbamoylphosphate synthase small subunit